MHKAYKDSLIVRDTSNQDGNHSECVFLPMEYGSTKTRLDNHPNVNHIAYFWIRTLSYQPIISSVLTELKGFYLDQRERIPYLRGNLNKQRKTRK